MSSDSSTLTSADSGPPPPRPAAAGLMKFMFTSGPARQDLSRPLALEDLMTGDVSKLTRRHEDFGGPGLLRSLPVKKLALSKKEGSGSSSDQSGTSSVSSASDSESSSSSSGSGKSSSFGAPKIGQNAQPSKSSLHAEGSRSSESAKSSQNSQNSGLFSAPDELPPEFSEEPPEDLPEPPESFPEPTSAGEITFPQGVSSISHDADAQKNDNSDELPPQTQPEDQSEGGEENENSLELPQEMPSDNASPEPQVAVAVAGSQPPKQPASEEDSSEPVIQILQPRVQTAPVPPRPALAEKTLEEQPPYDVPELRAESATPSELPPLDSADFGREEPPAARERVLLPRETPIPVTATREGRRRVEPRDDDAEPRGQFARRELKGREVQTEQLPAEVVARPARSVDVQVNYVEPEVRGISESGV